MRYFVLILLPFLSLFLQSTIFSFLSIKGAIPNLVLIFVVFFALLNSNRNRSAAYGFLCGLLVDLYIGRFICMNALALGATAFFIGSFEGRVFKENLLVGTIAVAAGICLNNFFLFLLSLIYFNVFHFDVNLLSNILYQGLYNVLLAIPIYAWYYHSTKNGLLRSYREI
ncbi:MAG TPA: rod shape-determining protein MreD [Syntrophomonadaceae bacterium]|nr:rod shape-determining protein MreD [Syntrophomonadaceae bacterium]